MTEHKYESITEALPRILADIQDNGDEVGSRQGERVMELLHQEITLTNPVNREVLSPGRNASLPAQIAETMWVLSGRDDIDWLSHYLPRAKDFSDDGTTWRGAYGARLRRWQRRNDEGDVVDQLRHVIDLLREDPLTRRATMVIYDPDTDTNPGKDIPCNNWITFNSRKGYLHMHVATRSNDAMWGWSGINAFEWSVLQEIVAGLLGLTVGNLHFSISSLHLYDRHWKKATKIEDGDFWNPDAPPLKDSMSFQPAAVGHNLDEFDMLVQEWFQIEEKIRRGDNQNGTDYLIAHFPEAMMRSWLRALNWWWNGIESELKHRSIIGTRLQQALLMSPNRPTSVKVETPEEPSAMGPTQESFVEFVCKLHAEKHEAYGNSWKKRGEQIGIMANIARKVDRLGVSGAGDTSADTAIDLLVYLAKYRLWLIDYSQLGRPDYLLGKQGVLSDFSDPVSEVISQIHKMPGDPYHTIEALLTKDIREEFSWLEKAVTSGETTSTKSQILDTLTPMAYCLAYQLWASEQKTGGTAS